MSSWSYRRKFLIIELIIWNERYIEYEWNGYKFTKKRKQPHDETMNRVAKCQEAKLNRLIATFDHKVVEGWLSDMIDSSLGYISSLIPSIMTYTRNGLM